MIDWADVRNVFVYPAMIAGGIAWSILFALRYRACANIEVKWAALIGLAIAVLGALGIFSLWLRVEAQVPTSIHNGVFTVALVVPAVVVVAGSVRLFWLMWRREGGRR